MKKRTKNRIILISSAVVCIVAFILALPTMFNTKNTITFKSEGITLMKSSYDYTGNSCENDACSRNNCLNPEELPEEIRNFKICFCCINFDFKEGKDRQKNWEIKDYKLKMFYQNAGKEIEKPFFTSDPSTEFPIPNFNKRFISVVTHYSQPYYFEGDYPKELKFNLHTIKISYRKIFEFITSQS